MLRLRLQHACSPVAHPEAVAVLVTDIPGPSMSDPVRWGCAGVAHPYPPVHPPTPRYPLPTAQSPAALPRRCTPESKSAPTLTSLSRVRPQIAVAGPRGDGGAPRHHQRRWAGARARGARPRHRGARGAVLQGPLPGPRGVAQGGARAARPRRREARVGKFRTESLSPLSPLPPCAAVPRSYPPATDRHKRAHARIHYRAWHRRNALAVSLHEASARLTRARCEGRDPSRLQRDHAEAAVRLSKAEQHLKMLRSAAKTRETSTAFVVFPTRRDAAVASRALHSSAGRHYWRVCPAPEPRDVVWGNLSMRWYERATWSAAAAVLVVWIVFNFLVVCAGVASLVVLRAIARVRLRLLLHAHLPCPHALRAIDDADIEQPLAAVVAEAARVRLCKTFFPDNTASSPHPSSQYVAPQNAWGHARRGANHALSRFPVTESFINGYLASFVLVCFLYAAPYCFRLLARAQGTLSRSAIEARVTQQYYWLLVVDVFFGSSFTEALFSQLDGILESFSVAKITTSVALAMPGASQFFLYFVLTRTGTWFALQLLRVHAVPELLAFLPRMRSERAERDAWKPGPTCFGDYIPMACFMLLLGVCYSTVAPVVVRVG